MLTDIEPRVKARVEQLIEQVGERFKDRLALPELRRLRGDAHPDRQTDRDTFGAFNIEDGVD